MAAGAAAATSVRTSYRLATIFVLTTVALVHSSNINADLVGRFLSERRASSESASSSANRADIWRRNAERLSFDLRQLRRRRDDSAMSGERQQWKLGDTSDVDAAKVDEPDNDDDANDHLRDREEGRTFEEDRLLMLARQLVGTRNDCDGIGTCTRQGDGGGGVVNLQKRPGKWIARTRDMDM